MCVLLSSPLFYTHRYQQVAKATFEVQAKQQYLKQLEAEADRLKAVPGAGPGPAAATSMQQQQQQPTAQQQQQQHPGSHSSQPQQSIAAGRQPSIPVSAAAAAAGGTAAAAGQGSGMMRVLEGTAQEVYRALLFVVFTIEVYVMSLVPFAGGSTVGTGAASTFQQQLQLQAY
jgi:hypothetical protein